MPEQWKSISLGEVCEIKYGKDHKPLAEGDIPVYGSGGIIRFVDKALYSEPSVLIPRLGSLDNLFYAAQPFWTVNTLFWTKIDTSIVVPRFLYYYLHTKKLSMLNHGSAVPRLTVTTLHEIKLQLPSLKEQERIAELLGALDNKIESNYEVVRGVTELQTVIFVARASCAPVCSFTSKFKPILGGTPSRKDASLWNGEFCWASVRDMSAAKSGIILDTSERITTRATESSARFKLFPVGSIFLSARGTVGVVTTNAIPCAINQSAYGFEVSDFGSVLSRLAIEGCVTELKARSHGSVFSTITSADFLALEIPDLSSAPIQSVAKELEALEELRISLTKQNSLLGDLRDTLLPELMSGRMQVEEARGLIMNALETEDTHV